MKNVVIIPTNNRPKSLDIALKSIEKQTLKPDLVIVIDDFSTEKIIINESSYELNIKLIHNKFSLGAAKSRNIAIKSIPYKDCLIYFLDDDDEFIFNKIALISNLFSKSKFDILYHRSLINFDNENISYISNRCSNKISKNDILISNKLGGTVVCVVSKSIFLKLGGFDENLNALEDYEFGIKAVLANVNILKIDNVLTRCHYVTKKRSMSKSISNHNISYNKINEKYKYEIDRLSYKEKKIKKYENLRSLAFIYILNYQKNKAAYQYIKSFYLFPSVKNIFTIFFTLISIKILLRIRALKYK